MPGSVHPGMTGCVMKRCQGVRAGGFGSLAIKAATPTYRSPGTITSATASVIRTCVP
jgi:hypothetical protein